MLEAAGGVVDLRGDQRVGALGARSLAARLHLRASVVDAGMLLAYLLTTMAGRVSRVPGSSLRLVWPAAGVGVLWWLLAVRSGRRRLWVAAVGLAVASYLVNFCTGASASVAALFAVVNLVQPWAVVRWSPLAEPGWHLTGPRELWSLVRAGVLGVLASAVVLVPGLHLLVGDPWGLTALQWCVRNGASVVVLVALVEVLAGHRSPAAPGQMRGQAPASGRESGAHALACLVVTGAVFSSAHEAAWALVPLAVWLGLRLSIRVAGLVLLAQVLVVMSLSAAGLGPFATESALGQLVLAHAFVTVLVLLTLLLGLMRDERAVLLGRLVDSERHYRLVADHAGDAIGRVGPSGEVRSTSPATSLVFGRR